MSVARRRAAPRVTRLTQAESVGRDARRVEMTSQRAEEAPKVRAPLRPILTTLCAVALAGGLVACGDDDGDGEGGGTSAPSTSFTLRIGDLVPLTGDLSPFGPPGRKAADLAVAQIEQATQAAESEARVSVQHADTETASQAAVQAARRLISNDAGCLAGAWASSNTIPVGTSVAARQRVPLISPASTSAEITDLDDNGFVFRVAPSDNLQATALADTVERELGNSEGTVSLAARNDAYGEGFINGFKQAWEQRGGTTTGPVLYDPQQPSYNSEAGRIVRGNPDAFVIIDFPDTFARMGAALVRTGDFDATKLFTADGLASDEIPEGVPRRALAGAKGTRPGTPERGEAVERFNTLYEDAGGPARGTFDAHNFDATMLCFLGAAAAGSADGREIQEQLRAVSGPPGTKFNFLQLEDALRAIQEGDDIDFDGVTGPIDWDENGDPTSATYEVWTYGDDGRIDVLRQFAAEGES
jgi:ABC-type branched-subunit amino acid transport system substrate-binding protein